MPETDHGRRPDHDVQLSNDLLLLRAFRGEDAESLYTAVRESMTELGRWLSWCQPQYTLDDTRQFLKSRGTAFQQGGEYGFAIVEQTTARLVGACGINQIDKAALRANLGYWLRTSATGRGYASQAALLVARWAFESLQLERIEIVAATGNHESQRVATRIGATRECVARGRLRVHGVQHDAVVFSLLRRDLLEDPA